MSLKIISNILFLLLSFVVNGSSLPNSIDFTNRSLIQESDIIFDPVIYASGIKRAHCIGIDSDVKTL